MANLTIDKAIGINLERITKFNRSDGTPFWTRTLRVEQGSGNWFTITAFADNEDALNTPEEKRELELRDAEYKAHCEYENAMRNGRILGFTKGYVPSDCEQERAAYDRWIAAGGVVDADAAPAEAPTGTTVAF